MTILDLSKSNAAFALPGSTVYLLKVAATCSSVCSLGPIFLVSRSGSLLSCSPRVLHTQYTHPLTHTLSCSPRVQHTQYTNPHTLTHSHSQYTHPSHTSHTLTIHISHTQYTHPTHTQYTRPHTSHTHSTHISQTHSSHTSHTHTPRIGLAVTKVTRKKANNPFLQYLYTC